MWTVLFRRLPAHPVMQAKPNPSSIASGLRGFAAAAANKAKQTAKHAAEGAGEGAKEAAQGSAGELGGVLDSLRSMLLGKASVVLTGGAVFVTLNYQASKKVEQYYRDQVYRTLERGFCPGLLAPEEELLPRRRLRERLMTILGQDSSKCYYLVTGPNGNGKSTLLRDIVRSLGGGVGYIEVDPLPEVNFGKDLGAAISYNFEEHLTLFNFVSSLLIGSKVRDKSQEHPMQGLKRAAEALQEGAERYRREHGRPFVLVIDNIDRLAAHEPRALKALQDYAKDWSQENTVTIVFVCGAETPLQERSSWSRAFEPIDVPDVSDEEAATFLRQRGVAKKDLTPVVQVTGGRLELLEKCAIMLSKNIALPEVQCEVMRQVEPCFVRAGLLDTSDHQAAGLKVVHALLEAAVEGNSGAQPGISHARWRQLMPDAEGQDLLMSNRVVAEEFSRVTFHSRAVQVYTEHMLPQRLSRPELWDPPKRPGPHHDALADTLGPQA